MKQADWKITDAFLWCCDRNNDRLDDPAYQFPSLTAISMYPTIASPEHAHLVEAAREVVGYLRSGTLRARRIALNGTEMPIAPGYWNRKTSLDDPDYADPEIVISADLCVTIMPTGPLDQQVNEASHRVVPMSNNEVEAWCRAWIASGKGNGMDMAWNDFKILPRAKGLSRDDAFRPAFKSVKKSYKQ